MSDATLDPGAAAADAAENSIGILEQLQCEAG